MIKKIKQLFSPELRLKDDEKSIYKLVVKLLSHEDSRFKHAPLSFDILIVNQTKGYSLLVNNSKIKITNHVFSLEKSFRVSFIELVKEKLYEKMEAEKQAEIKEIFSRDEALINGMLNNLD